MCNPDTKSEGYSKRSSSPPPIVQAASDLYGSDGSDSDELNEANTTIDKRKLEMKQSHNTVSLSSSIVSGIFHGILWCALALNIPVLFLGRTVTDKIYPKANYNYDPAKHAFDNTIWTYGTDYALAAITGAFALWILQTSSRSTRKDHKQLARVSATMLVLYSISTGTGAIAHQFFLTIESRKTLTFRLLWTVCVGTVFLAPCAMGIIGNECLKIFQPRPNCPPLLKSIPRLTDTYWIVYGLVGTIGCAMGYMSFQRPACDIFIAGGTQTPCTFYCMAFLYLVEHPAFSNRMRIWGLIGFIMNAFMLPLYPYLLLDLGWSLPATNTLLHTNLCVAWSLQGLVLQRVVKAVVEESADNNKQQLSTKKVQ